MQKTQIICMILHFYIYQRSSAFICVLFSLTVRLLENIYDLEFSVISPVLQLLRGGWTFRSLPRPGLGAH